MVVVGNADEDCPGWVIAEREQLVPFHGARVANHGCPWPDPLALYVEALTVVGADGAEGTAKAT
eukprot:CAMPEP_0185755794 /NCGR_PEP_ID=MMETSP1174-20130828/14259_1 /TAXON_ID=35687 /ORGANISM="Dictyocha speculum, Strain CCMP1381" /LENGTH=63 /DNA_ID=CAMNT_0028434475 /DNA_START=287 /DNA_END=478 /DNA_ORIENTATION=+